MSAPACGWDPALGRVVHRFSGVVRVCLCGATTVPEPTLSWGHSRGVNRIRRALAARAAAGDRSPRG